MSLLIRPARIGAIAALSCVAVLVPAGVAQASATDFAGSVSAPGTITYGSTGYIHTRLTNAGVGVPGAVVELDARLSTSSTFHEVASATSTSTGSATFHIGPRANTQYQVVWTLSSGDAVFVMRSDARWVNVAQAVTASAKSTTVEVGHNAVLFGTVAPNAVGKYVYLEYRANNSWKLTTIRALIQTQTLPNKVSTVSGYVLPFQVAGSTTVRVYRPATLRNAAGASRAIAITAVVKIPGT